MNIKDFILGYLIGKNDGGGGSGVEVEPLTVTENGEYSEEGVAYSPVTVNVPSSGVTNIKTGTFKPSTTGVGTLDTGYTGNGYPIACLIIPDGGVYNPNSDFYSLNAVYAIGEYVITKGNANSTPAYTGGADDGCAVFSIYKSAADSYSRAMNINTAAMTQANPSASGTAVATFKDKKTLCYLGGTSSYCFNTGITYRYWIVYSE